MVNIFKANMLFWQTMDIFYLLTSSATLCLFIGKLWLYLYSIFNIIYKDIIARYVMYYCWFLVVVFLFLVVLCALVVITLYFFLVSWLSAFLCPASNIAYCIFFKFGLYTNVKAIYNSKHFYFSSTVNESFAGHIVISCV